MSQQLFRSAGLWDKSHPVRSLRQYPRLPPVPLLPTYASSSKAVARSPQNSRSPRSLQYRADGCIRIRDQLHLGLMFRDKNRPFLRCRHRKARQHRHAPRLPNRGRYKPDWTENPECGPRPGRRPIGIPGVRSAKAAAQPVILLLGLCIGAIHQQKPVHRLLQLFIFGPGSHRPDVIAARHARSRPLYSKKEKGAEPAPQASTF